MIVTGGQNPGGFWKMSPAELFAWCDARMGKQKDLFDDMSMGEELED